MNLKDELDGIISNLLNKNFIKAHDDCENLWRVYKNDTRTREESFILKAFVNGIGTLELLNMNRIEHSKNVWLTYKKYENLIDELDSCNTAQYKQIQKLILQYKDNLK